MTEAVTPSIPELPSELPKDSSATEAPPARRQIGVEPTYQGKRPLDFTPFEAALAARSAAKAAELDALLITATVSTLQQALTRGQITAVDLCLAYLDRIRTHDSGELQSVGELNPDLLTIAAERDAERQAKHRAGEPVGPLHGIPIVIKDNIGTGDLMHTTAGAKALENLRMDRDASIVAALRAQGAIIMGKANLSEWAYWMSTKAPSGFSVLGGQVRNPHGPLQYDPVGSSSGSAVAVAARLAPLSLGSETCGSISAPSSANGIVGLKPSIGLISRDRIIPITSALDTAGPMATCVADVALLFAAMVGADANDPPTQAAASFDVTAIDLHTDLHGLRIGLPDFGVAENDKFFSTMIAVAPETRQAIEQALHHAGAVLVPVPLDFTELSKVDPAFDTLLEAGFRLQLNALLQTLGDRAPIKSLAGVIAFNAVDPTNRAPYGQDLLVRSEANVMSVADYAAFAESFVDRYRTLLLGWLNAHRVDAILTYANTFAGIYATAGCPALTVPAGKLTTGEPFGATFMGAPFSEPTLLRIGAAFERALRQA